MNRAIVVLVEETDAAQAAERALRSQAAAGTETRILVAPAGLRGEGLWLHPRDAQAWWETEGLDSAEALILVAQHRPGLAAETTGLESRWAVWCQGDAPAAEYEASPNTSALIAADASALGTALAAMLAAEDRAAGRPPAFQPGWGPFRRTATSAAGDAAKPVATAGAGPDRAPDAEAIVSAVPGPDPDTTIRETVARETSAPLLSPREPEAAHPTLSGDGGSATPQAEASIDAAGTAGSRGAAHNRAPSQETGSARTRASTPIPARWAPPSVNLGQPVLPLTPFAALAARILPEAVPAETASDTPSVAAPATTSAPTAVPPTGLAPRLSLGSRAPAPAAPTASGGVHRQLRRLLSRDRSDEEMAHIGRALVAAHSTVILTCTRKGGSGKTSHAVAIATLAAEAVEPLGQSVALLDCNLTNPDIRTVLSLPAGTPTVRDIARALATGHEPPRGIVATGTMLEIYAEERETSSFSETEIINVARHVRRHHAVTVIDLPNALPAFVGPASARVVALWLAHADIVVTPVDLSEASFTGAMEMLDAIGEMLEDQGEGARAPGVVVPLLLHDGGRALRVPAVHDTVEHLRESGAEVIEIPVSENVQLASWERERITDVDPRVTRAYRRMLLSIVRVRNSSGPPC